MHEKQNDNQYPNSKMKVDDRIKRDEKPDSHIYLDGKTLKEMKEFAEAYFEESFVHIYLNREDWVFDIMIKNYSDKARLKNFENRFPKCRVTGYTKD